MLGPDPYDLPSSKPSESLARTTDSASGGHLAWLGLGIALCFFCFALPLWLLFSGTSMFLGTLGVAELLERTRGLAPTTYGGAFWLAVVFIALMVLLELRAIFRSSAERPGCLVALFTRPSLALFWLLFPTILLVRLDIRGTDVPDVLTTFLLLCTLGYLYAVLPLALLTLCFRIARRLWRVGKATGFRAGVFGTIGLALAAIIPVVCADADADADADTERLVQIFEQGIDAAEGEDLLDGSRAALAAMAAEIDPPGTSGRKSGSLREVGDRGRFDGCIEELSRPVGARAPRARVERSLLKHYPLDPALANDIVSQKLLHVCLKHSHTPIDDLLQYLFKAAKNATKTHLTRDQRRRECLISRPRPSYAATDPYSARDDFADFVAAFCKLDKVDQDILLLSADGLTSTTIGQKVGLSAAAVRKRKQRLLAELSSTLNLRN